MKAYSKRTLFDVITSKHQPIAGTATSMTCRTVTTVYHFGCKNYCGVRPLWAKSISFLEINTAVSGREANPIIILCSNKACRSSKLKPERFWLLLDSWSVTRLTESDVCHQEYILLLSPTLEQTTSTRKLLDLGTRYHHHVHVMSCNATFIPLHAHGR